MLDSIKTFFSSSMSPVEESDPEENKKDIRLAACALLLELAYADEEFTEDEREHLESAIRRQYGLEPTQATQLIGLAEEARAGAVDLWQFTSLIAKTTRSVRKWCLQKSCGVLSTPMGNWPTRSST